MANICRDGGGGYATTDPPRLISFLRLSPSCAPAAPPLAWNHNTPSPTALRRVEYVEHLKHPEHPEHLKHVKHPEHPEHVKHPEHCATR